MGPCFLSRVNLEINEMTVYRSCIATGVTSPTIPLRHPERKETLKAVLGAAFSKTEKYTYANRIIQNSQP